MKLFLDENISPKAEVIFRDLGYDVSSVQSRQLKGITDDEVFEIAQGEGRVLITHNGRHFIIRIPPKVEDVTHDGLIWLQYQLTRMNAELMCGELDSFFRREMNIKNCIWVYKKPGKIVRHYPPMDVM